MTKSGLSAAATEAPIHLYGWNDQGGFWHGPTEIAPEVNGADPILRKLRNASGTFYGKLHCSVRGIPGMDFQTTVYDLTDAGLAIVHLDGDPIGVVAVIPAQRRQHLRQEFAFGFVSFLSFLGAMASPDSELAIHDYVENVLRTDEASALVFTVEGAQLDDPDTSIVTSVYFENLSIAMLHWLCMKNAEPESDDEDLSEVWPAAAVCAAAGESPIAAMTLL